VSSPAQPPHPHRHGVRMGSAGPCETQPSTLAVCAVMNRSLWPQQGIQQHPARHGGHWLRLPWSDWPRQARATCPGPPRPSQQGQQPDRAAAPCRRAGWCQTAARRPGGWACSPCAPARAGPAAAARSPARSSPGGAPGQCSRASASWGDAWRQARTGRGRCASTGAALCTPRSLWWRPCCFFTARPPSALAHFPATSPRAAAFQPVSSSPLVLSEQARDPGGAPARAAGAAASAPARGPAARSGPWRTRRPRRPGRGRAQSPAPAGCVMST